MTNHKFAETDEHFKKCPLSSFSLFQFERLFLLSGAIHERGAIQKVPFQEIVGFYRKHLGRASSIRLNAFVGILSKSQKA